MPKKNKHEGLRRADEDVDRDEDGALDVEQFPLPAALLEAAGIESDEDWQNFLDAAEEDAAAAETWAGQKKRP